MQFSLFEIVKISTTTNITEAGPMGLSFLGLPPCSCQCWSGHKAPKLSTLSNQVRANAAPYIINTTTGSTTSSTGPCLQCKLKMDQAQQHQHLQIRQHQLANSLNCSHHQQQMATHCHCQTNQNLNTPVMTFPVPPPSMPSTVPSFVPATGSTMTANNQMYFVPFNVPNMTTGTAPPIFCPHHPPPALPTNIKSNSIKPPPHTNQTRSVSSLRTTVTATVKSRFENVSLQPFCQFLSLFSVSF